jgi:quercetin dioxygenase-like cupin family protein
MAKHKDENVLSIELTGAIASDLLPTTPAPEVASRIKEKLLGKIKAAETNHRFMFADQGDWRTIASGVQVKVLRQEADSRSVLVKMAANSVLPAHDHAFDEEAIVLEGEVWLEGILCGIGDYHLAHAGGNHQAIHTQQGCLLFIRNA